MEEERVVTEHEVVAGAPVEAPRRNSFKLGFRLFCAGVLLAAAVIIYLQARPVKVKDFKQCVAYGYPVTGTTPQVCTVGHTRYFGSYVATPTPSAVPITYETVGSFSGNGSYAEKNDIIDDQDTWQQYWTAIHSLTADKPQLPAVDFAHKTVVAISQGPYRSDAVGIQIISVTSSKDEVVVHASTLKPGQTCAALSHTLDPAVMIAIDTPAVPIRVDLQPHSRQCS